MNSLICFEYRRIHPPFVFNVLLSFVSPLLRFHSIHFKLSEAFVRFPCSKCFVSELGLLLLFTFNLGLSVKPWCLSDGPGIRCEVRVPRDSLIILGCSSLYSRLFLSCCSFYCYFFILLSNYFCFFS